MAISHLRRTPRTVEASERKYLGWINPIKGVAVNHEHCEQLAKNVLAHFGQKDVIRYSLKGAFDGNWDQLTSDVNQWWEAHKTWAAQDTLADAYKEQRLTVKGSGKMNQPISAHIQSAKPKVRYDEKAEWGNTTTFSTPIVKTNASILARMNPAVFMPGGDAFSRKTELGYHDLSALLLNPKQPISKQQFKSPDPGQIYVFMPLSYAIDQAVFHYINSLAKIHIEDRKEFYDKVREIRSQMTRIKLLAEHDMATAFVMVGKTKSGHNKFQYTLISKTDVSRRDEDAEVKGVAKGTFQCMLTTYLFGEVMASGKVTSSDRENIKNKLTSAGIFDKSFSVDEFKQKVEAAMTPIVSKWDKTPPKPFYELGKKLLLENINKFRKKTEQLWTTTPGILKARQTAAINFQAAVLGEMNSYAEVTIAYRKHPGLNEFFFPKFATFDDDHKRWILGTVNIESNDWTPTNPVATFPDQPI